jgi:hypothetical protein
VKNRAPVLPYYIQVVMNRVNTIYWFWAARRQGGRHSRKAIGPDLEKVSRG